MTDMIMKAYTPALSKSLGIFIPLIVVNCLILARSEAFASKNNVVRSIFDGLGMGLGFTLGLSILSAVREVFGAGKVLGYPLFSPDFKPALVMILPPGAFIVLGCLLGLLTVLRVSSPGMEAGCHAHEEHDSQHSCH